MALNLITGYAGTPHITSENDGAVNAALYGSERYVLNTGQKFAYEIISNNLIRIKDGYAMNQGRKIGLAISEYEDLTIDNGLQGVKRSDIIVIRYTKNLDTGIESADFVVVKGTSGDAYKDPTLETGNIIQGDSVDDLPLYRVKIDGLSIVTVEPMFNVLKSMQEMQDEIASNASAITELNSNLGKLPTMIDFGQFTLTGTGSIVRQTFSFNKTFPSTPKIFFTIQRNSSTNLLEADIMTISADTESCYYAFKGTNGCSYIIHWLAVC